MCMNINASALQQCLLIIACSAYIAASHMCVYFCFIIMSEQVEEEIAVSGSLFSVSLFEEKLMKNFLLISNKLRKLEGLVDLEHRTKAIEKEFKFLSMKVDTITQKLPKDTHSLTKSDVKVIAKDLFFDLLNSNEQKLSKTKFHTDLIAEIAKAKQGAIGAVGVAGGMVGGLKGERQGSRASFTAGQALREEKVRVPKQALQECLNDKEMQIVSQIVEEKKQKEKQKQSSALEQLSNKYTQLCKAVEQLRMGRGYASFLEREAQKFQRFQQFEQKSRQTARKLKEKPIALEGVKQENVKAEIMKRELLSQVQRMELNKEEIARHELMQRKTLYNNSLFPQVKETNQLRDFREVKEGKESNKEGSIVTSIRQLKEKEKESFKRSASIKKLDRLDRRLRVDDMKDLNSVLREIELRIESKVSHDIFMGFVRDFEEKLELVRLSRDTDSELGELRKNVFVLESKVQSVVGYLQSLAQEDEALLVKKQWTCVSCDKGLEKYQGKVGQHLNWDNVNAKKMSPTKAGAFGQTGQLAAKIRNLMQGEAAE